ncbi:MAG: hypothetical protein ACYC2Y_06490 [Armatimonadota bacterium]
MAGLAAAKWAALAVGVMGTLFGLLSIARGRAGGIRPKVAIGFFVWPNSLSAGIAVVAAMLLALRFGLSAVGVALGWLFVFAVFQASRLAGRKMLSEAGSTAAYGFLTASGLVASSVALLATAIPLLSSRSTALARTHAIEAEMLLAAGFWVAATFWSFPSALYRTMLAREEGAEPQEIEPLCMRFRSVPGEASFLAVSALAVAVAMGIHHFPKHGSSAAAFYPVGAFASALVFALLAHPFLAPGNRARQVFGVALFALGTGVSALTLALWIGNLGAFYSFGVGLAAAALLMFTARYRPPFAGSSFGTEIAVAEVLMLLASVVLAFRWMQGYGIALCGVGLFSTVSVLFTLGALWGINRSEESADIPFVAHAASRFAEVVMAGGAFVVVVAILRLFYERAALGTAGVDITEPYPLIGLVIGASFPILLRSVFQSGLSGRDAASFDREVLVGIGRWAAVRSLWIWLLSGVVPLLVVLLWRPPALGAFLVGLAAAELFLILTLWLGEVRNSADEGARFATRSTHVLTVGSALMAALLAPPIAKATDAITRMEKLWVALAVAAIALLVVVLRGRDRRPILDHRP